MNLLNRSVCEWTLLSWVVILICAPSTECIKETVSKKICNIVMERTIKDQPSGPALKVNFTVIPLDANFRIEKVLTARIQHIDLPVYCYTFCSDNNCSVQCSEEFSSAGLPMKDYGRKENSIWYSIGLEDICRFHYLKLKADGRYENSERDKQHAWLLERFPILAMSLLVDGKRGDSTDDVTLTDDTNYTLQLYKYYKDFVPHDLVYNEPFEEVVKLNGGHCRKVVNSTGGERVGNCISVRSIQYQCPTPPAGEDVELTVGEEVVWRRTLSKPVEEVKGLTADDSQVPSAVNDRLNSGRKSRRVRSVADGEAGGENAKLDHEAIAPTPTQAAVEQETDIVPDHAIHREGDESSVEHEEVDDEKENDNTKNEETQMSEGTDDDSVQQVGEDTDKDNTKNEETQMSEGTDDDSVQQVGEDSTEGAENTKNDDVDEEKKVVPSPTSSQTSPVHGVVAPPETSKTKNGQNGIVNDESSNKSEDDVGKGKIFRPRRSVPETPPQDLPSDATNNETSSDNTESAANDETSSDKSESDKSKKKSNAAAIGGGVATGIAGVGAIGAGATYLLRSTPSAPSANIEYSLETERRTDVQGDREMVAHGNDFV